MDALCTYVVAEAVVRTWRFEMNGNPMAPSPWTSTGRSAIEAHSDFLSPVRRQINRYGWGLFGREALAHCTVVQASVSDGLSLDPFSFQQDGIAAAEVDVGGRQVSDGLMVTLVVVMIDEGVDLSLEIAWQVIVLEQDAVLQRLMPTLDLALGLGMEGSATNVPDAAILEPGSVRNIVCGGTVVNLRKETTRCLSSQNILTSFWPATRSRRTC
jgi:hypothetical protein